LKDLFEEDLYDMASEFFERSRFGDVTGGAHRLLDVLTTVKDADSRRVLVLLAADLIGLRVPMSHNVEAAGRRLARDKQISAQDLLSVSDEARRLDFGSGTEQIIEAPRPSESQPRPA
jgi:hypothetical protein